ncbi:MAG: hypothetical protein EOO44_09595 [Flavobacterium sp.]|nr:MAG: hypothetical protein EOO44_09595 [Flavobacterium sp.]
MKKNALLILLIISLSSCATVFNKKTQTLSVTTNITDASAKINDSIYKLPVKIIVKRSKKELPIELVSDSLTKKYTLKPSVNGKFVFGNLLFFQLFPVGYITDFTNQKRFYYQDKVFLDVQDSVGVIKTDLSTGFESFKHHFTKEYPTKKGQINFVVALPYVNTFHSEPTNETPVNQTGFFGFSAGIEYFYTNKRYFSANFRAVTDFKLPFPAPLDQDGEYERLNSISFGLTHNHKIKRFSVGYGLNYSRNGWYKHYDEYYVNDVDKESTKKINKTLGATLNSYYQISSFFFIGVNYNQSFLNLNKSSDSKFENVISLDFTFKLSPNKNRLK